MISAIIAAGASVAVAVIGKGRWWARKHTANSAAGGHTTARISDVSESLVAVGTNIKQHHGTVQNYYGVAPTPAGPFAGKVATKPSMVEIGDAIDSAKPYDQAKIKENYKGVKVSWPVIFSSINQFSRSSSVGIYFVSFNSPDADFLSVSTYIDIDKYPKLKVIDRGHPAWIEGLILTTDLLHIQLADGAEITLE